MYYEIVRFYQKGGQRKLFTTGSLEAAQAHCKDPETSSRTCTTKSRKAITRRMGEWFEGYREVKERWDE